MDSHFTTADRQRWMAVLAHSEPQALAECWQALNLKPQYDTLRAAETGLVQLKARAGATGEAFFAGDATLTRAAVRLASGVCGYSWVLGRDKAHSERCALIDALMQEKQHYLTLLETLINPLEACRAARLSQREAEVNASRVDFFTLVRGDNE
ncbi:phosphonate C-P lyase system protein PhnG [Enterobacteriaceae bacterium 4M9]|nr:phosphonate C-P lyase system protein PhnG [Enterobacteriaceae bacterium 4M9]